MRAEVTHLLVKILVGVWVFLLLVLLGYTVRLFILPFVLGGLLALLLQPSVDWFEGRFRQSRQTSIIFGFGLFLIPCGLGALYLAPEVYEEVEQFQTNQKQFFNSMTTRFNKVRLKIKKETPRLYIVIPWDNLEKEWLKPDKWFDKDKFQSFWIKLTHGLEWLFSILVLAPMFAFFLLKDGSLLKHWSMSLVPNRYFEMVMEILYNINKQIVSFVRGQFWDSSINALLYCVVLSIVGLPYALIVGLFAGIANAAPVIGPMASGILCILIAILTGTVNPWLIFFIFLVIHIIDITFIYPTCVGHNLRLHEFVVLLGVFLGGYMGGIVGMLVAVPLLGIAVRTTEITFRTLRGYRIL